MLYEVITNQYCPCAAPNVDRFSKNIKSCQDHEKGSKRQEWNCQRYRGFLYGKEVKEIGFDLIVGEVFEPGVGGDARIEGATASQAQGVEKIGVADQDEGEGGLLWKIEPKEHADFFECAHGIILSFVEHQNGNDALKFGA